MWKEKKKKKNKTVTILYQAFKGYYNKYKRRDK